MAKRRDKGLYLPLKIDLKGWEQDLLTASSDLQKQMRVMHDSMKDLRLRYDIDIESAKAAGNMTKAMQLENAKLNQLFNEQKKVVQALSKAYQESVRTNGQFSRQTQDIGKSLLSETKALNRLQRQLDSKSLNLGQALSNGLAKASPVFAEIRNYTRNVTASLGEMGTAGMTAAKALGGIGVAAAGIGAVAGGLEAVTQGINNVAKAGVAASDSVYQLRERMHSSYEDAEYIFGVTKIDGSNAESLVSALNALNKALLNDTKGTSAAAIALKRYGAELINADGTVKSYKEQLEELSRAYRTAAKNGEIGNWAASFKGALATGEFDHLLNGLESYSTIAKTAAGDSKVLYSELHSVTDWTNAVAMATERLASVKGGFFAQASVENLKAEVDSLVATANALSKNAKLYDEMGASLGSVTKELLNFKGASTLALQNIVAEVPAVLTALKPLGETFKSVLNVMMLGPRNLLPDSFNAKIDEFKKKIEDAWNKGSADYYAALNEQKSKRAEIEAKQAESKVNEINEEYSKKRAEETTKEKDSYKKFYEELEDAMASAYEKEILQIQRKKQAWIDAGISEVDAHKLYTQQKEQIDAKYYQKQKQEREKQIKDAESAYQKEADAAKRARESAISSAQSTLQQNLKLLRYIQNEQQKGTYSEDAAKKYADKLFMKSGGYNQRDIDFYKDFGQEKLAEIANARDRLFGWAGQQGMAPVTNNNQITVNFDNALLEDVTAQDRVAENVAQRILTALESINGNQQGYVYGSR
jgi:hypothetical protein